MQDTFIRQFRSVHRLHAAPHRTLLHSWRAKHKSSGFAVHAQMTALTGDRPCKEDLSAAAAKDVHWHCTSVTRAAKEARQNQKGCALLFTGLSGAGKSTVACAVEQLLFARGCVTVLLDGDNLRHGLNKNLGFTEEDRTENIRRTFEVGNLMVESGIIALCSLIAPLRKDRDAARRRLPDDRFIEIHLKVPVEVCEQRDPKGLWKAARAGKIRNFTGIDAPYEDPLDPEIVLLALDAQDQPLTPEQQASTVVDYLEAAGIIPAPPVASTNGSMAATKAA